MTTERSEAAARFLLESHQARENFRPIPAECRPRDPDEAYAAQDAFNRLVAATEGPVAGYKVALTTAVMQELVGYHEPVPGVVMQARMRAAPGEVACSDFTHLGVECELAVRLGERLAGVEGSFDRDRVAAAVESVMPAFELVDDRNVLYAEFASHILSFIADNAWNGGVVLGPALTDWRSLDLGNVRGTMDVNGESVGEGHGRDVMGHPLDALAWLANVAARRGGALEAGKIVMTGSIIATRFVHPGDRVGFALEGFDPIHIDVV